MAGLPGEVTERRERHRDDQRRGGGPGQQHRQDGATAVRHQRERTRPGSTTTCSAARTTTPPTGRPPRRGARSTRVSPSAHGRTARSWAGLSAISPRRRGSASSPASAPASRRRATPTRSLRGSRLTAGSCTSITTVASRVVHTSVRRSGCRVRRVCRCDSAHADSAHLTAPACRLRAA